MANISKRQRALDRVLDLRADGTPIQEIAKETGLSEIEVVDTIGYAGLWIKTQQAIVEEAELSRQQNTQKQRVDRLSSLRDSIVAEIEKRGLKEISTDKLIGCLLKVEEAIERNTQKPIIYPSFEIRKDIGEKEPI